MKILSCVFAIICKRKELFLLGLINSMKLNWAVVAMYYD